ncbi:MAG: C4-type zinc ribbon domain-containing protein [Verrucomicrobiota bacterium]
MIEALEKLLVLQDRDVRFTRVKKELNQIPKEAALIESKLKSQSAEYEEHKKEAQHIEAHRQAVDVEVKTREENIKKYQSQQLQTKKNEEYQALTHEIKRAKDEIRQLEDKELDLMEKYEEAKKAVDAEHSNVVEYEETAKKRRDELTSKEARLKQESTKLEAEITELEKEVPPQPLRLYRRLIESKGDKAIVPVVNGHTCGGCLLKLTQQEIVDAKGAAKLVQCGNCGRVLYWQDEFA